MNLPVLSKRGFTLVELMIAISIVAILATVGFTVYSTTQNNARDTKRKQDLDAIASALESKKTPGSNTYTSIAGADFASGSVPTDPKSATQVYCLLSFSTSSIANTPIPVPPTVNGSGANSFSNETSCANNINTPGDPVESIFNGTLPANTSTWKICAFMEQGTNQIYCKTSN